MSLGRISLLRGDLEAGSVFLEESLAILRTGQGPWGLALVLNGLGDIARRQGDYERARTLYEEGLAHFRSLGSKTFMAGLLHNLGYVSLEQQDVIGAAKLFAESLTLFHEAGDKRGVAECLAGLGAVAAVGSQPERSARLFGASEAQLEIIGAPLSASNLADYERNLAIARRGLDDDAFAAAWFVGRAMPLEQAVADALDNPGHP
jgi:tetratricopeptide (TPR) repeat protein